MEIGVLDIQGSVEEHFDALERLAASLPRQTIEPVLVKKASDFADLDGLVLPGGESTTISKLVRLYGLDREIVALARRGGKIFGTCAGAILLARGTGDERVEGLGLIDIDVDRNAYGRQLESFETEIEVRLGVGGRGGVLKKVPAVFIRAPKITRVGSKCEILAEYEGEPVLVRGGMGDAGGAEDVSGGNILVATFHPEMSSDLGIYKMFFLE